jgi:protease-4
MTKNPFVRFLIVILVLVGLGALIRMAIKGGGDEDETVAVTKNGVMQLDLEGVIYNGKKFVKHLKDYREDDHVKGFLVVIDSPGGSVGPSQEMYAEMLKTREEYKKPIVCVSNGLVASGGYYAASACDKLVVAPGALIGSIGVIMSFANLNKLYDWAHVERYSITSGKYKDSGAEYRPMREDEKQMFQELINEVYGQFKAAVMKGRNLKEDVLSQYADGRVFTGAKAVELGFADKVGTYEDASKMLAEITGLGDKMEIYEVPKKKRSIWDFGSDKDEDPVNSFNENIHLFAKAPSAKEILQEFIKTQWLNRPVLIMPGYWQ